MSRSAISSLKLLLLVLFAIGPVVCWLAPRLMQNQEKTSLATTPGAKVDTSPASGQQATPVEKDPKSPATEASPGAAAQQPPQLSKADQVKHNLASQTDRGDSVAEKTYRTSDGDMIKFFSNGRVVEVNGNFGTIYAGQAIYFGEDGHSPRTDGTYIQDGNKITLTFERETKATFTLNKDRSLSGPSEGLWKHGSFAHLVLMN